ncbi:cupin domain-containing protein [Acanthopleuribacter pedis]|uniref:Cupin domain-containing protein n=1 Tax=Acanthopleuribacter pedis TaxID=442870 RepID=A0A8J7U0S8_9BACT|nr:cupin domain-containing protein [Acanthopleuribacter pedis]MBO1317388.1 cupin domain-containing protein [Acanthopleuribacter pedis]
MGDVNLNMDFNQQLAIETTAMAWSPSPAAGVERKRLERENAESGRATSVVRYGAGSSFPTHVHGGGEEFLVLEGVFSDENGHYPVGSYVRNPPGSSHAPFSDGGCTILVKLHQMDASDQITVVHRTTDEPWSAGEVAGHARQQLNDNPRERVSFEKLAAGTALPPIKDPNGQEFYVVSGSLRVNGGEHPAGTWLRFPPGETTRISATTATVFWHKRGHLAEPPR